MPSGEGLLIHQCHPCPSPCSLECGVESCRSRADDEQIHVQVCGVVAGGIRLCGKRSLTGDPVSAETGCEFDGRGKLHRFRYRSGDLNKTVWVFGTGRCDAAGAAKLDAVGPWWTPLDRSADPSVSPAYPSISVPSNSNERAVSRVMCPPVGVRYCCVIVFSCPLLRWEQKPAIR